MSDAQQDATARVEAGEHLDAPRRMPLCPSE